MIRVMELSPGIRSAIILGSLSCLCLTSAGSASAGLLSYVTGTTPLAPGVEVIFRVTYDPAVSGSAIVTPVVGDPTIRLDGIDFVAGSSSLVVVGAQKPGVGGAADGGAIAQFNVVAGTRLADFVANTNTVVPVPPPSGSSKPSTVLSTATHVYYTENQFGFAGGTNRIMRTAIGGPAGTAAVIFDGAALGPPGFRNFEGLEIVGSNLYFFGDEAPATRALYSIGLTALGLWDGLAPLKRLGGLTRGPGFDGSDELDFDPATGFLYGTNIVSGEVIKYDPVAMAGGFLISPGAIAAAAPGSSLARLGTGMTDGIRATGTGFLVLTGLDGVILSIDLAGVAGGLDTGDVKILYEDSRFHFDDLTPSVVPLPTSPALFALACLALFFGRMAPKRAKRRQ